MSILVLMIPIALLLASCFVAAFVWGANKGQFDDLETPAFRILNEDPVQTKNGKVEP